jgi:hypothetical protein
MAWPLDQEADPITIYLESTIQLLVASGNRVVFSRSFYTVEPSIWYIGQTVQKMGSPSWSTASFRLRGVIFHPTDQQRLYFFYQPRNMPRADGAQFDTSLQIQEYLHGTPQRMWVQPFVSTWWAKYSSEKAQAVFMVEAMDDEGLVSIRSPGRHVPCDENGEHLQRPPCDHDNRDMSRRWVFASFNILTGEFNTHANHVRDIHSEHVGDFDEFYHLVWRDQTVLSQPNMRNMSRLVALNSCGTQHRSVSPNLAKALPSSIGFDYQKMGTAFIFEDLFDITDPNGEHSERTEDTVERLWGDDDFLVWCDQSGYIVWSFDETTTLPRRWAHGIEP